jgi:Rrf2 family protein
MIYSNACAYTIRVLSRLAMLRPNGYVLVRELCDGADLPRHFVAKIFQGLVREGLLLSAKGRGGGFALARPPSEIYLAEIVAAVDGLESLDACVVKLGPCNDQQPCPQHDQWEPVRAHLKKFLTETTLEDMSKSLRWKIEASGHKVIAPKSPSKPVFIPTRSSPARPTRRR